MLFLNWVLMFGKLGAPALGAVGCGIASATTMWLMMIGLGIYMMRRQNIRTAEDFFPDWTVAA